MSRIGSVLALAVASVAVAQPPTRLDQLGAVVKSQPDFYGAIAGPVETVKIAWTLSAPTVELGGSVTLTLTVRNAVNPRELKRPDLAALPAFKDTFSPVADVPTPEPAEDAKAVEFVYTLRPRDEGRIVLAPPRYLYFKPNAAKLPTAFADPPTLTVTKPVAKAIPPVPLAGPESFFEPAIGSYSASGAVPSAYWLALLLAAPVVLLGWVLGWRWLFPNAARLARLRRNRAVRRTLDRLRAAHRKPDPAGETAAALRSYLAARFGLSPVASTPSEVYAGLHESAVPADRIGEADELLRRCDADRFAPLPTRTAIVADAIRLVERWEGMTG